MERSTDQLVGATFTGHRGPVYALASEGDGDTFLSGSGDGLVVRWKLHDPEAGHVLVKVGQAVFSLLRRGTLLLIGTEGGDLFVIDAVHGRELHRFTVHRKGIFRMVALSDNRIACAGGDGTLSIWRTNTGNGATLELVRHFPLCEEKLRDLAVDTQDELLAVACGDGQVRILDTTYFNEKATIAAHPTLFEQPGGATSIAFHPHKPVLISGGKDGYLRSWHATEGFRPLLGIPAHKGSIYRLVFNPDGQRFCSVSRDKTVKLWDANTLEPIQRLDRSVHGHTHSVNAVLWTPVALLTASDDRMIKRWEVKP